MKIVLNTKGTANDVSEELKDVLHYIGGEAPKGDLAKELDVAVTKIRKSEKWRREYMTLFMRDKENQAFGALTRDVSLIRKKLNKQCSAEVIADAIECDIAYVEKIISMIQDHSDWDDEDIASELEKE